MDIDVIRAKQDSIVRCIERIQSKADLPLDALQEDYDAQDVIVLNLERAIQQACDIACMVLTESSERVPETMRESFAALRRLQVLSPATAEHLQKAVGFRNTAVHAYQQIDWAIVHSIVHERLPDFAAFIREVDAYLDSGWRT